MDLKDCHESVQNHIIRTIGRKIGPQDIGQNLDNLSELHQREVEAIGAGYSVAAAIYLKVITDASLRNIKMYLDARGLHSSAD